MKHRATRSTFCSTCHQVHGNVACEIVASIIESILDSGVVKHSDQVQVESQSNGIMRIAIIHDASTDDQSNAFHNGETL